MAFFVFLYLLECEAERTGQLLLAHIEHLPAQPNPGSHVPVDRTNSFPHRPPKRYKYGSLCITLITAREERPNGGLAVHDRGMGRRRREAHGNSCARGQSGCWLGGLQRSRQDTTDGAYFISPWHS